METFAKTPYFLKSPRSLASSVCDKDNKELFYDDKNIYNLDKII
jgi:hypothetical protein